MITNKVKTSRLCVYDVETIHFECLPYRAPCCWVESIQGGGSCSIESHTDFLSVEILSKELIRTKRGPAREKKIITGLKMLKRKEDNLETKAFRAGGYQNR